MFGIRKQLYQQMTSLLFQPVPQLLKWSMPKFVSLLNYLLRFPGKKGGKHVFWAKYNVTESARREKAMGQLTFPLQKAVWFRKNKTKRSMSWSGNGTEKTNSRRAKNLLPWRNVSLRVGLLEENFNYWVTQLSIPWPGKKDRGPWGAHPGSCLLRDLIFYPEDKPLTPRIMD